MGEHLAHRRPGDHLRPIRLDRRVKIDPATIRQHEAQAAANGLHTEYVITRVSGVQGRVRAASA